MTSSISAVKIISQTSKIHSGTVIFLHGSGDTGNNVRDWIRMLLGKDISFPHLRVVFPTAPERPYTPMEGELSNVWFDRLRIAPDVADHLETLDPMAKEISALINKEAETGIPRNRIVIGGFSMGGAMAMHTAFKLQPNVAGVFALSSFLSYNSTIYESLSKQASNEVKLPPLFMCHGDHDTLVPHRWGEETFNTLQKLGVKGEFHTIKNVMHELHKSELLQLCDWINQLVPPIEKDS